MASVCANSENRIAKREQDTPRVNRRDALALATALLVICGLFLDGCRSHLNDSVLALDAATAPVIDSAAAAYEAANTIHNLRVDYDSVTQFDATDPVYNPRKLQVLLSEQDIQSRLTVLAAFQVYVKTLCAITSGTNPPELGDAATAVGGQIASAANTLAPSIERAAGVAASDGSSPAPVITPEIQNGISTGLFALGKFLAARKVQNELPGKIAEMDPHVQALAKVLESDIDILQDQEKRDYDRILNQQTLFIRKTTEHNELAQDQRRTEIMKLPAIVRQQRAADERLSTLRAAIVLLAQTHHELVDEAKNKNSESFKDKLHDLAAAAVELGRFYSSLG